MWDLGGQAALRTSWPVYYKHTDAIIVVVDSTDRARLGLVKAEVDRLLASEELKQASILIYANKQARKPGRRRQPQALARRREPRALLRLPPLSSHLCCCATQDLKEAADADELTQSLGLQAVRTHAYHVQVRASLFRSAGVFVLSSVLHRLRARSRGRGCTTA